MVNTSKIKLLAVDLDGTLLNSKHELSAENERALREAVAAGITVVIATGKTRVSSQAIIDRLQLNAHSIFNQGLIIYNPDGTVMQEQILDKEIIRRFLTFIEDRGFQVVAISGNRLLVRTHFEDAKKLLNYNEPEMEAVGPLQNILDTYPIHKFLIFGDHNRLTHLRWQLSQMFNQDMNLMIAGVHGVLEALPYGASKGHALKVLLAKLKIKPEEVMAIGDGENDAVMVELAGIGLAVSNGDKYIKAVADHVIESNDEDAVAKAIDQYIFGKTPVVEPLTEAATPTTLTEEKSEETKPE